MARIAIFGGSNTIPGEAVYESACKLGGMLAMAGHVVMTGGYIGVMEGVSRGASEAGGHVIGVTCEQIETWRLIRPNQWVNEEIRCKTLHHRLETIIDHCQAALVMPGGPGTLTEVSLMWDLMLTESIPPKPLILVGKGWQVTFDAFFESFNFFVPIQQREWLKFCVDEEHAFQLISEIVFDESN